MNTLTSMLRAVLGFVLGPKGRLSSSYSKTQHLKLVDGASKRSCMFVLFLGHGSGGLSASTGLILHLLRMRFLRISYVQSYRGWSAVLWFRGLGLQPDVVDSCLACGCACRRAKASAAEEASDACNAMVAFYMTNLSSRFC